MNATDWATKLLDRHSDVLNDTQVDDTRALAADGDGWLAAYDLFRDGVDDGWLTDDDLAEALDIARSGGFSKFSDSVEQSATAVLNSRRRAAI